MNKSHLVIILVIVVAGGTAGSYLTQGNPRIVGAKALVIVADGFAYREYIEFVMVFGRDGGAAHAASFNTETVTGDAGSCRPDIAFSEVNVSAYEVVYVVGGGGVDLIVAHQNKQVVLNLLIQAHNEGRIVAAICSGP